MRAIKLQHPKLYPKGTWLNIASEEEMGYVDDDYIYHYVETKEELNNIKAGDTIILDEEFKVLEVE